MSIIEEIKRDVRHEGGCARQYESTVSLVRMRSPGLTDKGCREWDEFIFGCDVVDDGDRLKRYVGHPFSNALQPCTCKAAEEDLP